MKSSHLAYLFAAFGLLTVACRKYDGKTDSSVAPPAPAPEAAPPSAGIKPSPVRGPTPTEPAKGSVTAAPAADAIEPRADLLTFAQGAIPLRVEGAGAALGAQLEEAVEAVDGDPTPYSLVNRAPADAVTELIYELPAATTFERFAVPNVLETPSAYITFTKRVEVLASSKSSTEGFELLAAATLETHKEKGQVTELAVVAKRPVRWVKVRLTGGIRVETDKSTFQFSELVGNGTQESPPRLDKFRGAWRGRGAYFDLRQDGPVVTGCFDESSELAGTVTGNILRASGRDPRTKVLSLFVLTVAEDGSIRGVRSTNGAPFRVVTSPVGPATAQTKCPSLAPPKLGCGSVVHGIQFAYDAAEIQRESEPVLAKLFEGLRGGTSKVVIEGHTSSEGADAYNLGLSERRAGAVVADLVRRGIPRGRITAVGRGEVDPIATNANEAGRSLNRRVAVKCQ